MNHFLESLPNESISDFYGELLENIAHDERSYGPSAFTLLLSSFEVDEDNNPRSLYRKVVDAAKLEEKEEVSEEAFYYFKGILEEIFKFSLEKTVQDISEDDLPF